MIEVGTKVHLADGAGVNTVGIVQRIIKRLEIKAGVWQTRYHVIDPVTDVEYDCERYVLEEFVEPDNGTEQ